MPYYCYRLRCRRFVARRELKKRQRQSIANDAVACDLVVLKKFHAVPIIEKTHIHTNNTNIVSDDETRSTYKSNRVLDDETQHISRVLEKKISTFCEHKTARLIDYLIRN